MLSAKIAVQMDAVMTSSWLNHPAPNPVRIGSQITIQRH